MNVPALRSPNAALVLDLLRTAGETGISRLELAERTGLTPQAVSKITARLRSEGLAAEAGHRASTGGKPRTVLRLVPTAGYAVGVHLDRDELTTLLTDLAGAVVDRRTRALDLGAGAGPVLDAVTEEVRALLAGAAAPAAEPEPAPGVGPEPARASEPEPAHAVEPERARATGREPARAPAPAAAPASVLVLGVGVAMPGPLDHRAGVPGRVTGFPEWDGHPVREELARRLGLPVVLDKDTNAAALGLAVRPGAPGSFAYVHLGTGLGAGLVLGGAPLRGDRTGAGELGHQTVQLDGPPCGCGGRGCLEVLCLAAVARGDGAGAARILGAGAANVVRLLDIDQVLLGGRLVLAAPEVFAGGVREVLTGLGLTAPVGVAGEGDAVAAGAAWLILAPVFGK
ncbi:ROK family transcriptional regulator [Streptomyces sp. NBC_00691]|uniref:ROK family transcriptional regulator n=1 Tax=Streptomyces sp. NBC_00691 TaxID=2903671 RepID=UPI002E317823|nr:ROK family transcriptional regulator [Streptomyces sp. NBC_00691]